MPLYIFLLNKWYVDELYEKIFVNPAKKLGSFFWKKGDIGIIDKFGPDGISKIIKIISNKTGRLQTGFIYDYAFVMLLGLSIYTAAFISETVRSGIISVSKGQREASQALGLKSNLIMKLIIIPQALRVIIPPLTSQYLNLTKNSSLGIAIGYADLVHGFGGISLNQTGRAIEIMLMVMLTYLTISLIISFFMNIYNKAVQFKGNA